MPPHIVAIGYRNATGVILLAHAMTCASCSQKLILSMFTHTSDMVCVVFFFFFWFTHWSNVCMCFGQLRIDPKFIMTKSISKRFFIPFLTYRNSNFGKKKTSSGILFSWISKYRYPLLRSSHQPKMQSEDHSQTAHKIQKICWIGKDDLESIFQSFGRCSATLSQPKIIK